MSLLRPFRIALLDPRSAAGHWQCHWHSLGRPMVKATTNANHSIRPFSCRGTRSSVSSGSRSLPDHAYNIHRHNIHTPTGRSTSCLKHDRFYSSSNEGSSNDQDQPSGKKPLEYQLKPKVGEFKNPLKMLAKEVKFFGKKHAMDEILPVPRESDIVIIGGGAVGMSVAYWLKQRNPKGFTLTVIEKDPTYTRAATSLSLGGIRQQFSLTENIQLSKFSAEFIRNIKDYLSVLDMEPPDVNFNPQGYLFLAGESGVETLRENHQLQTEQGAHIDLMDPSQLKAKFPWLNVDDLALGSYGVRDEGWFDPWLYLMALKMKCMSLGVRYIKGEVVGFSENDLHTGTMQVGGRTVKRKLLEHVHVKVDDGCVYPIKAASFINCGGPWAGEVAKLAGIGNGDGALAVPLPVEPRKRYVYSVHCPNGPGLEMPFTVDTTGVYVRREGLGGHYLCGVAPDESEEPSTEDLCVDEEYFHEKVWPVLCKRIPAFEQLKLKSSWAGYYDYNYFDHNWIVGNHPYHQNLMMAVGGSGHGLQHSAAIGRAIMELIIDDEFQTIDLSRFQFDRVLEDAPIFEKNIV